MESCAVWRGTGRAIEKLERKLGGGSGAGPRHEGTVKQFEVIKALPCSSRFSPWGQRRLGITMTEITKLTPAEQAEHFRKLADEADIASKTTRDPLACSYVNIGKAWRTLASEVDTAIAARPEAIDATISARYAGGSLVASYVLRRSRVLHRSRLLFFARLVGVFSIARFLASIFCVAIAPIFFTRPKGHG